MRPPRLLAIGTIVVALAIASPAPAPAQSIEGGMPRAGEPSWADYASPERRHARQLRRAGLVLLLDATGESPSRPPDVLYEQALLRFARARLSMPEDPDLLYFTALALAWWHADTDLDGEEERRTEEALGAFADLRRLDPAYHPDRVAFELAILHTRNRDPAAAVDEYRRAIAAGSERPSPLHYVPTSREESLAQLFSPVPLATVHLNLGESAMLIGDLESSVESYRRAVDLSSDPRNRALALWGLSVAIDRSGDHREALVVARRAIAADPIPIDVPQLGIDHVAHGPMAILHSALVFFEPAFEVHAYDAIGWEALARQATVESDRQQLLTLARRAWRTFLTSGGNGSRFADHATRAVEQLEPELPR